MYFVTLKRRDLAEEENCARVTAIDGEAEPATGATSDLV